VSKRTTHGVDLEKGLERLDFDAMQAAQDAQDAVTATRLASDALFGDLAN